ncbi:peptidase M23 family protein [Streptomyces sp. NBRC 110611]|uniref:hypothetical protein n=1 Tax=Streptomyces sp. NBRC 110611 TaxID=1621259 RepID=UPI0008312A41|nr:hypothetical protein [Streptomyces sp. NBRC 110611]GAU70667.1 peptidase M23 family protein [Streptomyces sp. NBRC 110611]
MDGHPCPGHRGVAADQRQITHATLTAAKFVKRGLLLKSAVIGAAVFLLLLMLAGALLPAPASAASSCEDTGPGTDSATTVYDTGGSSPATGSVHAQQITNAQTIDKVAKKLGLPGKATLVALMTAMQEGVDLGRAGTTTGNNGGNGGSADSNAASGYVPSRCPNNDAGSTGTGGGGGTFSPVLSEGVEEPGQHAERQLRTHAGSQPAWLINGPRSRCKTPDHARP